MPKRKANDALNSTEGGKRVRIAPPAGGDTPTTQPATAKPAPAAKSSQPAGPPTQPGSSTAHPGSSSMVQKRKDAPTGADDAVKRVKDAGGHVSLSKEGVQAATPSTSSNAAPANSGSTDVPEQAVPSAKAKGKQRAEDPSAPPTDSTPHDESTPSNPTTSRKPAHSDKTSSSTKPGLDMTKYNIRKLVPPRPFPTVPTSVSATGPRSAHGTGKNYICVTRHTPLGAYLRRCKDVFVVDGYTELHLHALGAAIPHLAHLATSLPSVLPFPPDQIQVEVRTGTVGVTDELVPTAEHDAEDEDADVVYRTRDKAALRVVVKVAGVGGEGGEGEGARKAGRAGRGPKRPRGKRTRGGVGAGKGAGKGKGKGAGKGKGKGDDGPEVVVVQEPEQEVEMDEE